MFIRISPGRSKGAGRPPGSGPSHAGLGFRDFAEFGGVIEDGADGAEADFRVLILRVLILWEVAGVKDSLKGEASEAAFGEVGGLALQLGKLVAEFGSWSQRCKVRRPTLERREAWAMEGAAARTGSADCWRGERREFFISEPL